MRIRLRLAAMALFSSLLITSCTTPMGGADEILRIDGGISAGLGTVCDSRGYSLDLTTGQFSQLLPVDGSSTANPDPEHLIARTTLTEQEISQVRDTLGGRGSSTLLDRLEKKASASQAKDHLCMDGGSASLHVTYTDGTERTIRAPLCYLEGPDEVLAPLDILPDLGTEHGFSTLECEEMLSEINGS